MAAGDRLLPFGMPIPSIGSASIVEKSFAKYCVRPPPWFHAMMMSRTLEDWWVSESKRAGVPLRPSSICRPCDAADAVAAIAAARQATPATSRAIRRGGPTRRLGAVLEVEIRLVDLLG